MERFKLVLVGCLLIATNVALLTFLRGRVTIKAPRNIIAEKQKTWTFPKFSIQSDLTQLKSFRTPNVIISEESPYVSNSPCEKFTQNEMIQCCSNPIFPVLAGLDVVAAWSSPDALIWGSPNFQSFVETEFGRYHLYFESAENQKKFEENSNKFLPVMGGFALDNIHSLSENNLITYTDLTTSSLSSGKLSFSGAVMEEDTTGINTGNAQRTSSVQKIDNGLYNTQCITVPPGKIEADAGKEVLYLRGSTEGQFDKDNVKESHQVKKPSKDEFQKLLSSLASQFSKETVTKRHSPEEMEEAPNKDETQANIEVLSLAEGNVTDEKKHDSNKSGKNQNFAISAGVSEEYQAKTFSGFVGNELVDGLNMDSEKSFNSMKKSKNQPDSDSNAKIQKGDLQKVPPPLIINSDEEDVRIQMSNLGSDQLKKYLSNQWKGPLNVDTLELDVEYLKKAKSLQESDDKHHGEQSSDKNSLLDNESQEIVGSEADGLNGNKHDNNAKENQSHENETHYEKHSKKTPRLHNSHLPPPLHPKDSLDAEAAENPNPELSKKAEKEKEKFLAKQWNGPAFDLELLSRIEKDPFETELTQKAEKKPGNLFVSHDSHSHDSRSHDSHSHDSNSFDSFNR